MLRANVYFVDSGFWMAHFYRKDQWHAAIEEILRELTELRVRLITSDVVVLEFITLARRVASVGQVEDWVQAIFNGTEVTYTIAEDLTSARKIIATYVAIPFSGFDASSIAVMERLAIQRALSVDDEFIKCSRFVDVRPNLQERRAVVL